MDAEHLYSLLNQKVTVVTSKKQDQNVGYLVCVDPVTLTIVLYDDINQCLSMIFHHAIRTINKDEEHNEVHCLDFQKLCHDFFQLSRADEPVSVSVEEKASLEERRSRVLNLLKENNVPVEEQDDLLIAAYGVCINPPYTEYDCKSNNALILSRIQNILRTGQM